MVGHMVASGFGDHGWILWKGRRLRYPRAPKGKARPDDGRLRSFDACGADSLQTLEKELVKSQLDKALGIFTVEGWESVIPALPESCLRCARSLSRGEVKDAFFTGA